MAIHYKGSILAKASAAAELHAKGEFEKLDKHLKEVNGNYLKAQGGPMPAHLENYKLGEHPEDIARGIEKDRLAAEREKEEKK